MKQMGMLFACVLLTACSSKKPAQEPMAEPAPAPVAEPAPEPAPAAVAPQPTPTPAPPPAPAAPPAPAPAAAAMTATADLKSVKDGTTSMGTLTFEKGSDGQITINGMFNGLKKKGAHAFYIHEKGDCGNKGKNVGKHLNPTKAKHGPPSSPQRHAGDFGDLTADEAGNATFSMATDSITMEGDRPDSVINRAAVIHANKDNKAGNAGPAIACGVIQLKP